MKPVTFSRVAPYAICGYSALALVLAALSAEPPHFPVAALAAALGDLLTLALALRTARAAHLSLETRRLWRILAYATAALTVGHVLTFGQGLLDPGAPPSLWFEIPYLSYYPLVLAAILSLPLALRSADDKARFWLDTATVIVAGGIGIWYFVLYPGTTEAAAPLDVAIAWLYLLGDLVLLLGVVTIWFRRGSLNVRRGLVLLAVAFLVDLVTNVAYAIEVRAGSFQNGGALNALWLLATGFMALSATAYHDVDERPLPAPETVAEPNVLPFAAVLFGCALLVTGVLRYGSQPLTGLVTGALVLTLVVVVRQVAAVRENVRLQAEAADRRSEARFGALVAHSSDVISILDPEGVFRFASPAAEKVVGRPIADLLATSFLDLVHPSDRDSAARILRDRAGVSAPTGLRLRHPSGSFVYTENIVTNLLDEPSVAGLVVNTRDVTEKRRLEEALTWQAFHDPLTGLPNRSVFLDRVSHALSRRARGGGSMAVLFVDLDNFKLVNDILGHAEGDRVLVAAGERLMSCVRSEDTVARFGGDEYAILLEDGSDAQAVEDVARRIVEAFAAPFELKGQHTRVGASIGIALSRPGEGPEELLRKADEAMYFAKTNGKGRYEMFALEMHTAVWGRLESEKELQKAVAGEEFELYYQPILRLGERRLAAFEALLRWHHPTRGLLTPEAFIPLAEETGLIVPIGRWVMREACRQWASWRAEHPDLELRVSVNVSARHFQDVALVTDVGTLIHEFGLPPGAFVIEITESLLLQHTEATREKLRELKALGLSLAVDDFGTGYSSLGYLHRFPLDILKIDKTFVDGIGSGSGAPAIARAIVGLAQALHLETVAEGIETEAQAAALKALGCRFGQGYLFARPQPPAKLDLRELAARAGQAPLA
jgi:diguanylate cyclase (GGDEF)-like protein/PAS domain S-box-containing protein